MVVVGCQQQFVVDMRWWWYWARHGAWENWPTCCFSLLCRLFDRRHTHTHTSHKTDHRESRHLPRSHTLHYNIEVQQHTHTHNTNKRLMYQNAHTQTTPWLPNIDKKQKLRCRTSADPLVRGHNLLFRYGIRLIVFCDVYYIRWVNVSTLWCFFIHLILFLCNIASYCDGWVVVVEWIYYTTQHTHKHLS